MKIKSTTPKTKRKTLFAVVAVVIVVVIAGGVYAYLRGQSQQAAQNDPGMRNVNTVDYGPPKSTDKIGDSAKDDTAKQDDNSNQPEKPAKLNVTITNTSQDSGTVYVRVITDGATSGTCKATFTRGSDVITKQAALSTQADYGICQGFNVPKTEFGQPGDWKIKVEISGNNLQGEAETTLGVTL